MSRHYYARGKNGKPPKPHTRSVSTTPKTKPALLDFVTSCLKLNPDPEQTRLLTEDPHRCILNCTRQWGKSTITAAKAIHKALTEPDSLILAVSPSARQSSEFLRKCRAFLKKGRVRMTTSRHEISISLPNRSRIIGLPASEDRIRGYSAVSLLLIDEAARVPDSLYTAVRPVLATTNGQLWLLSTPNACSGFFYREWASQTTPWSRFEIPASNCPRINPEFLEEERRAYPETTFLREYCCQFVDPEGTVFPHDLLHQSLSGSNYFIGVDLGQSHDYTAISILERHVHHSALRYLQRIPLQTSYEQIATTIVDITNHPSLAGSPKHLIIDGSGVGAPVIENIRQSCPNAALHTVILTPGANQKHNGNTHHIPRNELLSTLETGFQNQSLHISGDLPLAPALIEELQNLRRHPSQGSPQPIRRAIHDDLVFATALAYWSSTW
ncbi:MAG: terminase family protein [Acidobacteria bacterium]|nr:terminase family protein [Acidobacteriota bacterium]